MEAPAERPPEDAAIASWRQHLSRGRGRWLGVVVAVLCAIALLVPDPGPLPALRPWAFDQYQVYFPRVRKVEPAVIVAIDDESLRRFGQWPWSRDVLAALLDRIGAQKPGAIGIDIVFAERERALANRSTASRPPSNDATLAESIARNRVVLGVIGTEPSLARGTPRAPAVLHGPKPPLQEFPAALRSLPPLDHAAAGHAFLNAAVERERVRWMRLAASVGGDPMLTMALEAIRVGNRLGSFNVSWSGKSITSIAVGEIEVPTDPEGRVWLHFTPSDRGRYVSATDVLDGNPNQLARLEGAIVLVGVTAVGLVDQQANPFNERMPGIEFHAQLIENIFEDTLIQRPAWMRFLEAGVFALAAAIFIVLVPRLRPRRSFALMLAIALAMVAGGILAFVFGRALFDPSTPLLGTIVVFGLMVSASLVAADLERRELSEAAARTAGEFEAGRRIQSGILPTRESVMRTESRIDISAHMSPAREVGGDLYDFFPLSGDKFLVLVGDVSGKGLGAAMFMAVTKALAKSWALRTGASPAALMTMINTEVSRENPEQMFVTLVVVVMDLQTGELQDCNAGHEPPLVVRRDGKTLTLNDGGGPPLCVVDDFEYEEASATLLPRDTLAIVSDGITEAMNGAGTLYGRERMQAVLEAPACRDSDVTVQVSEVLSQVKQFEAGAEPADDQTLVLVSWRGGLSLNDVIAPQASDAFATNSLPQVREQGPPGRGVGRFDTLRDSEQTAHPSLKLSTDKRTNMRTQCLSGMPALSQPTLRGARAMVIGNPRHEPTGRYFARRADQTLSPADSG